MPHLHPGSSEAEGVHTSFKRTTLLVLAVTLHNIPEGMAVGLALSLIHIWHADKNGLIRWLQGVSPKPAQIFVNHGDDEACRCV